MTFFHRCAFRQSPVKRLSRFIGKSNHLDISLKFQIPKTHLSVKCKVFVESSPQYNFAEFIPRSLL